jgi:Haem-binding domain
VSWFIVDHVNTGRGNMNLSEWGRLAKDQQDRKLRQICDEVSDGAMPLSTYTPLHPGSKLSPAEVKTLCDWTAAERERLSRDAK